MKPPYFINVDLVLESKRALRPLAREFGDRVCVLFDGRMKKRNCLYVEMCIANSKTPEQIINSLCGLVERLPPKARVAWDAAEKKEFDVGYEVRLSSQRANHFSFRPSTLRRIAKLGATLAATLYREDQVNEREKSEVS